MKNQLLATVQRNPLSYHLDSKSTGELLTIINNEDQKVPFAVQPAIPKIPAIVPGSTRMKSGPAQKFILNIMTTMLLLDTDKDNAKEMLDKTGGSISKVLERKRAPNRD
jgi:N-acetylmuramic acid 6-phosphate (MurNAc-6-P) etherase